MQEVRVVLLTVLVCAVFALPVGAEMTAEFVDAIWDGVQVPDGQQCQKFEGHGKSPTISVTGIPATANLIILSFSDRTFQQMDNGGHGKIGFHIEGGTTAVVVPSVDGHTLDLPAGFVVVQEHQAPTWDKAGAYLPPCSGGRGNEYYVTVSAVAESDETMEELASVDLEMGRY